MTAMLAKLVQDSVQIAEMVSPVADVLMSYAIFVQDTTMFVTTKSVRPTHHGILVLEYVSVVKAIPLMKQHTTVATRTV